MYAGDEPGHVQQLSADDLRELLDGEALRDAREAARGEFDYLEDPIFEDDIPDLQPIHGDALVFVRLFHPETGDPVLLPLTGAYLSIPRSPDDSGPGYVAFEIAVPEGEEDTYGG